jgi:heme/copper-type cytochrome/quinol oxidase subunit 1
MPRRIQDYPYGYTSWHSMASLGHTIVLLGVINFFLVFAHAAYFKRPLMPRCQGFPFISTRVAFLVSDKYFAATAKLAIQPLGITPIRKYLLHCL